MYNNQFKKTETTTHLDNDSLVYNVVTTSLNENLDKSTESDPFDFVDSYIVKKASYQKIKIQNYVQKQN